MRFQNLIVNVTNMEVKQTLDLCEQLAQTDLSEDDTTILLKEASDLNKKLKAELKRMEERGQRTTNLQRTSKTSVGNLKTSGRSTNSIHEKHKKFLPPISSSPSMSHRALGAQTSPYASVKSNSKRKGVVRQSNERQSNSAGVCISLQEHRGWYIYLFISLLL